MSMTKHWKTRSFRLRNFRPLTPSSECSEDDSVPPASTVLQDSSLCMTPPYSPPNFEVTHPPSLVSLHQPSEETLLHTHTPAFQQRFQCTSVIRHTADGQHCSCNVHPVSRAERFTQVHTTDSDTDLNSEVRLDSRDSEENIIMQSDSNAATPQKPVTETLPNVGEASQIQMRVSGWIVNQTHPSLSPLCRLVLLGSLLCLSTARFFLCHLHLPAPLLCTNLSQLILSSHSNNYYHHRSPRFPHSNNISTNSNRVLLPRSSSLGVRWQKAL